MSDDMLLNLTSAQRAAVEHVDGPLLILAGPGSGKTRVVTHRVAHLLQHDVAPHQILALTFTNKAADEMRARLAKMVPDAQVWVGTFHRFCAQLLRRHAAQVGLTENFTIYDADDSLRTVKRAIQQCEIDLKITTADQVAQQISWAKNNLITHRVYQPQRGSPEGPFVKEVYSLYQRELLKSNAADFDDLLLYVVCLLRENDALRSDLDNRYRYILVDEYQDTNLAQYSIVRALSNNHPNLAVTGDPDQSIYGWRGASVRNILEFENDYPDVRVVRLEHNYRSTPNILHVADELIARNARRKPKSLLAAKAPGPPVRLVHYQTHKHEAIGIAERIAHQIQTKGRRPREFAVFYRVNALSRSVEDALRQHGIPYQVVSGVEFYQRKEIKDVLAYLQLINNPRDNNAFLRIVNTPGRGIGKTTLARLAQYAEDRRVSLLEAARRAGVIASLSRKPTLALARFVSRFDRMSEFVLEPLTQLIDHVLEISGYREDLSRLPAEEGQQRLANVEELATVAREFDAWAGDENSLDRFLEQTRLVGDTDDWDAEVDRVSLMTLHAAKGLEFPVVFIIALEEGLLPHGRARNDAAAVEEERRLLFVGITRAEQELQLSMANKRMYRGREGPVVPSGFAMELPRAEMEVIGSPLAARDTEDAVDYDDEGEPIWREEDFVQEALPGPLAENKRPPIQVMTAAQMLHGSAPENTHPDTPAAHVLQVGTRVTHPEYGLGKIMTLAGRGRKRTATVDFVLAGRRTFVLKDAKLRPASAAAD
jgi:DNA helicase-2/ATP-dependent DNA helicase PcrA